MVITPAGLECDQVFARVASGRASAQLRYLAKLLKEGAIPKDETMGDYKSVMETLCAAGEDRLHFLAQLSLCLGLAIEAEHGDPAFAGKPSLGSGPDPSIRVSYPDLADLAEEEFGGIDRACYMYIENCKDESVGVRSFSLSGDGGYCGLSIHHSVITLPSGCGYIAVPQVATPSFSFVHPQKKT